MPVTTTDPSDPGPDLTILRRAAENRLKVIINNRVDAIHIAPDEMIALLDRLERAEKVKEAINPSDADVIRDLVRASQEKGITRITLNVADLAIILTRMDLAEDGVRKCATITAQWYAQTPGGSDQR
jgi:hypothetical protein